MIAGQGNPTMMILPLVAVTQVRCFERQALAGGVILLELSLTHKVAHHYVGMLA